MPGSECQLQCIVTQSQTHAWTYSHTIDSIPRARNSIQIALGAHRVGMHTRRDKFKSGKHQVMKASIGF